MPGRQKRTRSVSQESPQVRTKPAKGHRETGAFSTYLDKSSGDLEVRTSSVHVGDDPYDTIQVVREKSMLATQCLPAKYEAGKIIATIPLNNLRRLQFNPISPFQNAYEYKLVRFFHESKTSLTNIDHFFKKNLLPLGLSGDNGVHFQSGYTWRNKMREMIDQPGWQKGTVDFHLQKGCAFYYRDLEDTVRYLLQQRAYGKHLVFEPIHEFDEEGNWVYTEMNTGDWWWRTQKTLPIGSSLVPVLLTSDQTCLTNFSGDKKLWPLFMSIGNIHSEILGPKRNNKIPGFSTKDQEGDTLRVQHQIVSRILSPLTKVFKEGGSNILCGDGKVRRCIPILSAWLADHMENVNIHGIKTNRCPVCIISPRELGILRKKSLPMHNHAEYERLYRAGDLERLDDAGIKPFENAL
ncbi:hypothetical protein BGX38DRAFT_1280452 [Terfezia claveryi]|nr:hypothetical protein BGX38DRAFT_1280452 [Terfezia claveryi]